MSNFVNPVRAIILTLTLSAFGCHAQTASNSSKAAATPAQASEILSAEMTRRIEVKLRSKYNISAAYEIHLGPVTKSDIPGYDAVTVDFSADGKVSKPLGFLISTDRKTLAQLTTLDISKDPKELVSGADRPARGGPANAPVLLVGFDDLECPFCSKMNAQLFPAVLERYKDKVRVVYRDFPLDQHPWAMRAAVDTNCVGAQSTTGYWNLVDHIHAHADEIGGGERTIIKANEMLDTLAREEGQKQNVDENKLTACIAKQDTTAIKESIQEAASLGVDSTPALFINGAKVEGAQPMEYIYRMIDSALIAVGQTPPPAPATQAAPAPKPGN